MEARPDQRPPVETLPDNCSALLSFNRPVYQRGQAACNHQDACSGAEAARRRTGCDCAGRTAIRSAPYRLARGARLTQEQGSQAKKSALRRERKVNLTRVLALSEQRCRRCCFRLRQPDVRRARRLNDRVQRLGGLVHDFGQRKL